MTTMTVPTQKYLDFADYLSRVALDFADAGMAETSKDYAHACGALLTLLQDTGLLASDLRTVLKG